MLSIGKLAHLAQLHDSDTEVPDNSILDGNSYIVISPALLHYLLTSFHDELDFVSVHEALLQEFRSALEAIRGRQTLDSQIETIVKASATGLQEKPALRDVSPKKMYSNNLHLKFWRRFSKTWFEGCCRVGRCA